MNVVNKQSQPLEIRNDTSNLTHVKSIYNICLICFISYESLMKIALFSIQYFILKTLSLFSNCQFWSEVLNHHRHLCHGAHSINCISNTIQGNIIISHNLSNLLNQLLKFSEKSFFHLCDQVFHIIKFSNIVICSQQLHMVPPRFRNTVTTTFSLFFNRKPLVGRHNLLQKSLSWQPFSMSDK